MRKIFGIAFILSLAAFLIFGNTVTNVNYNVKTVYGDLPPHLLNAGITYHVPDVVRVAGADIFRPEGYFTQSLVGLPEEGAAGVMVKALKMGMPVKLDAKKAKLLGLEPSFTFWEEKGKWFLLVGVIALLLVFFWR